jgi:hypothetical protein
MSIVLAIKQPGNTIYPCPKCLICVDNLFEKKPVRKNTDKHSRHEYEPWLKIDVNKLVPLPLHVMLGFTNKMIKVARKKLTDSAIDCVIEVIKTNHKRGGGGFSDLKELNGPEIRRWNKKKCFLSWIQYTNDLQVIKMLKKFQIWSSAVAVFCSQVAPWSSKQHEQFEVLYQDIKTNWCNLANCKPTPKMHIFQHFPEFALENGSVARFSESPTESFHFIFENWMKNHHFNEKDICEQARKCLASSVIPLVAPFVKRYRPRQ